MTPISQCWLSYADLARQMGRQGRMTVEREYSEAAHYDKLMAVYTDLMRASH